MRTKTYFRFDAFGLIVLNTFLVIAVPNGVNEVRKCNSALLSTAKFGLPQT